MTGNRSDDPLSASTIKDYITREVAPNPELLPIKDDTRLIESGILDSLSILKLVLFLEEKFGVKVAPGDVTQENFETVDLICRYLRTKQGT